MAPERREILEKVASGELAPEEAEILLNALHGDEGAPVAGPSSGVRRVRIEAGFGAIAVVGDPGVAEAEIEGLHSASVDGDTLVISGDAASTADIAPGVFAINLGRRRARTVTRTVRVHRNLHSNPHPAGALRVRLNPSLDLDARLDAGPLSISGMSARIRARSSAGPITIDGIAAAIDVHVNAGAIRIAGLLIDGESRVRSDAGAIKIELDPASSVHVTANALLGKVVLPDAEASKGFGSSNEATIGDGTGSLRVETAMGSINVSLRGW